MLRLLTTLVLLVVGVGVVAEVLLPPLIESRVERTVHAHTPQVASVEASTGDFPFVPGLLLDGVVDRLDVTLEDVGGERITIGTVAMNLQGIEVDRSRLLAGSVVIVDIASGGVLVEVTEDELSDALGVPVDLDPRMVELAGRALEIAAPGASAVEVPVHADLLPCEPDMEVVERVVRLRCDFDRVPGVLVDAIDGA